MCVILFPASQSALMGLTASPSLQFKPRDQTLAVTQRARMATTADARSMVACSVGGDRLGAAAARGAAWSGRRRGGTGRRALPLPIVSLFARRKPTPRPPSSPWPRDEGPVFPSGAYRASELQAYYMARPHLVLRRLATLGGTALKWLLQDLTSDRTADATTRSRQRAVRTLTRYVSPCFPPRRGCHVVECLALWVM